MRKMNKETEFPNYREGYGYARRQVRERRRDLEALELEYRLMLILPGEYWSCRRSLWEAILELETLLRTVEEELRKYTRSIEQM
jgi:hypothetical protein